MVMRKVGFGGQGYSVIVEEQESEGIYILFFQKEVIKFMLRMLRL